MAPLELVHRLHRISSCQQNHRHRLHGCGQGVFRTLWGREEDGPPLPQGQRRADHGHAPELGHENPRLDGFWLIIEVLAAYGTTSGGYWSFWADENHLRAWGLDHFCLALVFGRVGLPHALGKKDPHQPVEWSWHWVFPQQIR